MEEEEPIPMPQSFSMGHTSEGALQYQLETEGIVENLLFYLRGYSMVKDDKGIDQWKQNKVPMINDKGADKIRTYLSLVMSGQKVFALTDMSEELIGNEVISIGEDFVRDFEDNYTEYEISNSTTASHIVRMITLVTNAVLKKGENATYLKFLRTTQQISEVQHHQNLRQQAPQEGKTLKDMLFGKRR